MRLTQDVSLVGGGMFGFGLTSPGDSHVYLLDGGNELVLVDAGIGGSAGNPNLIIDQIRNDGYDPANISTILLTHYHPDHAGGASELQSLLGCTVRASPLTAKTVSGGDEVQISLAKAKAAGYFPADYRYLACPTEGDLHEGTTIQLGRLQISVFDTPGHCAGHISLLVEGGERVHLVQGDVIFFGGTVFLQNIPDCSIPDYAASTAKLAELEFDSHLPGHLGISLTNGKRHIQAANDLFEKLQVPRNLV